MIIILGIIFFVFGVLQIILFFKLWKMANDVNRLTQQIIPNYDFIIKRELYKNNPSISNLLFDGLWHELGMSHQLSLPYYSYNRVINKYESLYKSAGVEFPEAAGKIKTDADYLKFIEKKL